MDIPRKIIQLNRIRKLKDHLIFLFVLWKAPVHEWGHQVKAVWLLEKPEIEQIFSFLFLQI